MSKGAVCTQCGRDSTNTLALLWSGLRSRPHASRARSACCQRPRNQALHRGCIARHAAAGAAQHLHARHEAGVNARLGIQRVRDLRLRQVREGRQARRLRTGPKMITDKAAFGAPSAMGRFRPSVHVRTWIRRSQAAVASDTRGARDKCGQCCQRLPPATVLSRPACDQMPCCAHLVYGHALRPPAVDYAVDVHQAL